jgi:hypothetical protein
MSKPRSPRARLSPARDGLLAVQIAREPVVTSDARPLLGKSWSLSHTRAVAACRGKTQQQEVPLATRLRA